MANTIFDSIGRKIVVNTDFGTKRIFILSCSSSQPAVTVAVMTAKQALKIAAIIIEATRHVLAFDVDDD